MAVAAEAALLGQRPYSIRTRIKTLGFLLPYCFLLSETIFH